MATNPLLYFKKSSVIASRKQPRGGGGVVFPSYGKQAHRLGPSFSALEETLRLKNIHLQSDPNGVVQEQVLVLRTVGSVSDFAKAVSAIQGMEWLGEFDEEDYSKRIVGSHRKLRRAQEDFLTASQNYQQNTV